MATKKAGGSSKNGRDSAGRRLGAKKGDGQPVILFFVNVVQKFVPVKMLEWGRIIRFLLWQSAKLNMLPRKLIKL